jgi:Cu/Ag efflux pump CusA
VLGQAQAREAARTRLLLYGIVAAIGVFLLLQAAVGSWRLAALLFAALPLSLSGSLVAIFATGGDVTLGSLAGLLAVVGITARNGLLLVGHYHELARSGAEPLGPELVVRGARERLTTILVTTLAAAVALAPFALPGDRAGYELVRPMAIAVLGGLVTATVLAVVVVPALYLRFCPDAEPDAVGLVIDEPAGRHA